MHFETNLFISRLAVPATVLWDGDLSYREWGEGDDLGCGGFINATSVTAAPQDKQRRRERARGGWCRMISNITTRVPCYTLRGHILRFRECRCAFYLDVLIEKKRRCSRTTSSIFRLKNVQRGGADAFH